ncbi:YwmB family TATA-box binding protein [Fonticella tunisiensis]|uniref:TATA-box binding protein n=1 Tax=Fonticella tunisiensis TaxID=1096341 RepID=A0A4R7KS53_9CLOT|nr:YwmB family TATA-box binding protein [Fonticella tunisiensis]TDT62396.1 TATA-box binding protein [Fonticella tunisiensis]
MKKWGVLMAVLLLILYLNRSFNSRDGLSILYKSFNNTGAEFMKMEIEGHASFISGESIEKTAENIFKALTLEGEYSQSRMDEWSELNYRNEDTEVKVRVRKIPGENLTYASVTLSQYRLGENINNNIRRTVAKAFEVYKVEPSFSSLIMGRFNEKLSVPQMKERISSAFSSIGARLVEGMDERNMVSLTGYVKGISDRVEIEGKYINLNMALRYSETKGCTYIWIGSPIILTEY